MLTRRLLTRHLWRKFKRGDHEVLLELMQAFKLLRPLGDDSTFLVPAMLRRELPLPDTYVSPHWWRPLKASSAAAMHVGSTATRAEMRVEYQVLGGRLPFSFMSELQVSLALREQTVEDREEALHFAPEAAVVDRTAGSVLTETYKDDRGRIVREWAIVSHARVEQGPAESLRVMAWAELSSEEGATNWPLLRRVMRDVQGLATTVAGLNLRKMVVYVDAHGHTAKAAVRSGARQAHFTFKFQDGNKRRLVDVDADLLLPPSPGSATTLVKPQQPPPLAGVERNNIEVFLA